MIDLHSDGNVRVLRMDEGENRFNRSTIDALHAAVDEVAATEGPVALVTVGSGKFFSNGLDLDWIGSAGADDPGFLDDVHRLLLRVVLLDLITVAAINGHAFAGGAMLASAHDHRLMREDRGYWCLPEVDLGLPLTPAMFATVDAHVPRPALTEAALSGRRYTAPEALAAGIVTGVASEDDLLGEAVALAATFAQKDRRVIAEHKKLLYPAAVELLGDR